MEHVSKGERTTIQYTDRRGMIAHYPYAHINRRSKSYKFENNDDYDVQYLPFQSNTDAFGYEKVKFLDYSKQIENRSLTNDERLLDEDTIEVAGDFEEKFMPTTNSPYLLRNQITNGGVKQRNSYIEG